MISDYSIPICFWGAVEWVHGLAPSLSSGCFWLLITDHHHWQKPEANPLSGGPWGLEEVEAGYWLHKVHQCSCPQLLPCAAMAVQGLPNVSTEGFQILLCTISKGTRISLLVLFFVFHVAWLSIFSDQETISQVQRAWRIIPHLIRWSSSVTSNFVPLLGGT